MAMAIAQTAQAALNAYASTAAIPIIGPGLAPAAAITAAGFGAIEIAAVAVAKPKPPAYETGGIVPGDSYTGDKQLARVNSGEMILNADQQKTLFDIANGAGARGGVVHLVVNLGSKLLYDDIHDATVSRELIIDAGAVR